MSDTPAIASIPVTVDDVQIGTMRQMSAHMFVWQPDTTAMASLGLDIRTQMFANTADALRMTVIGIAERQKAVLADGGELTDDDRDPLEPALRPYVQKTQLGFNALRHPLLFFLNYQDQSAPLCNAIVKAKSDQLREAVEREDWARYIGLHEKPYRVNALSDIAFDMSDEEYWESVSSVWTIVESIHEDLEIWAELWSDARPGRLEHVMDEDELKAFVDLPPKVEIYRGYRHEECMLGMSWTTDRKRAAWFARRSRILGHKAYLATAHVAKADVLAYFLRREESEIVVLPENLMDVRQQLLDETEEAEEEPE